ncbi:putative hydrolase [Bacillus sp. TS-2]|nr:putative hydrolase [Bacillus sp. TS-2]
MIFFDIDDTLVDHRFASKAALEDFFNKYRNELNRFQTYKHFEKEWFSISEKYFYLFLENQISFKQQQRLRILHFFKELEEHEADLLFQFYLSSYENHWVLFDDVLECLKRLKNHNIPLGIISNGDKEQQTKKLIKTNIIHYFSYLGFANEIGYAKPNPQIFEKSIKQATSAKEAHYYVGDDYHTDIQSCEGISITAIWLNRNGGKEVLSNDLQISHLDELFHIIE